MWPEASTNLNAALERLASDYPDVPALVSSSETLSFRELRERAQGIASCLDAIGVRPGDAVGILGENSIEWATLLFGIAYRGGVVVGVNTWYTAREVRALLEHADIRLLVAIACSSDEDPVCRVVKTLTGESLRSGALPALKDVVLKGETTIPGAMSWDAAFGRERDTSPRRQHGSDRAAKAALVYTSGSTAAPKGVALSHSSLVGNAVATGCVQGLEVGDRVWSHFPFFFSGGLCNFLLGGLLSGATVVVQEGFEISNALREIQSGSCSVVHAWPNVIRRLIDHPDFSPERVAHVKKGTWPVDLWFGADGFPNLRGVNIYGLTETCTAFTSTAASDSDEVRGETHGRPFPGNEIKITDAFGARCAPGQIGEVRLKGFSVMNGYHKLPIGTGFDADGYLITQDLGELREDGCFVWRGRGDDMIRTNGILVSPVEVETVLESIAGVHRAGVTSMPDEHRGELVVALVSLDRASGIDEEKLVAIARQRLATYKVPKKIQVVPDSQLSLTGSGKIDRRNLRKLATGVFDA